MPHRYAAVKDETRALPGAVMFGHVLQVFQDAALQVVDLLDPLAEQVIGGFLAADASGAEHGDPLVVEAVPVFLPPGREIAKAFGSGVDCTCESANGDFIGVTRVDHRDIRALY